MAKIFFNYGAMGSSKSAQALMVRFNYEERGHRVILAKPRLDTKGNKEVTSRIGLHEQCVYFDQLRDIGDSKLSGIKAVIVDEAQFLTEDDVMYLVHLADNIGITILCYGLMTNFQGKLFEGSKALVEVANKLSEIKTVCWCGEKANYTARFNSNNEIVKEGSLVVIGANEQYTSLCRKHWMEGNLGK